MTKKTKIGRMNLNDDYTGIGLVIALGGSVFIIFVSVLMIYISTPPEKIYVAKVNGVGVMRTEFDKAVNNNKRIYVQYMKMDFTDPKNQSQLDDIKKNSLENLINRELYLQYAAKNNIVPDQSDIDAELEKIKKDNFKGDDKEFRLYLKRINTTLIQFTDTIYKDKTVEKVRKTVGDEKIKISDKDLQEYYDKNKKEFTTAEQVQASHILVKEEAKAKELYEKVKADPKKFAELAKENSTDPGSKDKGGDLGLFGKGQMVKEFEEKAWSLEKDTIAEPIKTQFGWHIIKKVDFKPEVVETFEKSKTKIKDKIKETKLKDVMDKFTKQLKIEAKIDTFDNNLAIKPSPSPISSTSVKLDDKKTSNSPKVEVKEITPTDKKSDRVETSSTKADIQVKTSDKKEEKTDTSKPKEEKKDSNAPKLELKPVTSNEKKDETKKDASDIKTIDKKESKEEKKDEKK